MPIRPDYNQLLQKTVQHALSYIDALPESHVAATSSLDELRSRLNQPIPATGSDPVAVIEQLVANVAGGLHDVTGGRFFGWVIGGSVPAALAADWLTSTWDQNAGMFAVAPAASVVEEVCGEWLLDLLGLPPSASFALVTGCQMAHVTCLAAARNAVLARHGWDVESEGLFGAPKIRVVTSDQRHGTIERALRVLGMGRDAIVDVPTGASVLSPAGLEAVLQTAPDQPTIVLLQAGDLNTGAFDSFEELIPIARNYHAWIHVDGAFGLWAGATSSHRHLTKGVEHADSWATDGHKWLNVPYDCGYAFVADRDAHFRAFGHRASYLSHSKVARDSVDWNPEYSRRARGFATYAAIASLGREGIAQMISDGCRFASQIVADASEIEGVEQIYAPIINQGLIRFRASGANATDADHDRQTDAVTAAIVASGEAFFSGTTWQGMRCMRVSVSGWNTNSGDVSRTVQAIRDAVALVAGKATGN